MEQKIKEIDGYSLKKKKLKSWIYFNGYTQPFMARKMGVDSDEFKRKLREKEKFNREEIRRLIYFMKARSAFSVIYFPSKSMRKNVWERVFGWEKRNE